MFSMKLLFVMMTILAGASRQTDETPLVDAIQMENLGIRTFWSATIPLKQNDSIKEAFLVDEALYVVTNAGSLYSIKKDVGLMRWGIELTEADYTIYRPTHARKTEGNGHVVIATTTATFLLDRYNGRQLRQYSPLFATGSSPIAHENLIFSGSSNGRFYSIRVSPTNAITPFKKWEVSAGGPVTAAPVFAGWNKLVFASQNGKVYACNASDKVLHWSFTTGQAILGDPAVDDQGVYVASQDRSLYKIDINDGHQTWRVRFPRPLHTGPSVVGKNVYQFCKRDGLSALSTDTGELKWKRPGGLMLAAHNKSGDIIYTTDHNLEVIDPEMGHVLGSIKLYDPIDVISNVYDDGVYILGSGGRVLCLKMDNVPYLRKQQVIAAQKQLNLPPEKASMDQWTRSRSDHKSDAASRDPLRSQRDTKP